MRRKKWSDLSPTQQRLIAAMAVMEVVVTTAAVADLVRRPADQVRGSKAVWAVGMLVQPVGPLAYLGLGRLPDADCVGAD
jgi:hypothetical protein